MNRDRTKQTTESAPNWARLSDCDFLPTLDSLADDERLTLAGLLLEGDTYMPEVAGFLRPEHFSDERHAEIYRVMQRLYDENKSIDLFSVSTGIKAEKGAKTPISYIAEVSTVAGTGVKTTETAQILHQRSQTIKLSLKLFDALKSAKNAVFSGDNFADKVGQILDDATKDCNSTAAFEHISAPTARALRAIEARASGQDMQDGSRIFTGLSALDNLTGGFTGGQVVVVAGRPAMGKSALGIDIATRVAQQGYSVAVFSLEMASEMIAKRLLCRESRTNSDDVNRGTLTAQEWDDLNRAQQEIGQLPIYVSTETNLTPRKLRSLCLTMKRRGRCDMVVIDYVGLMNSDDNRRNATEAERLAVISRGVKLLAKELDVPILLLAQLNRDVEGRTDKRPTLADLRSSGAIEQDADIVAMIYRPAYYGIEFIDDMSTANLALLNIAKNREGKTGDIRLWHSDDISRFEDYGKEPATGGAPY